MKDVIVTAVGISAIVEYTIQLATGHMNGVLCYYDYFVL